MKTRKIGYEKKKEKQLKREKIEGKSGCAPDSNSRSSLSRKK